MSKGRPAGSRNPEQTRRYGRADEVVEASEGKCRCCPAVGDLGNGLCIDCWDKECNQFISGYALTRMVTFKERGE